MKLSIVTTLYHSSSYLIEFYKRMSVAAGKITDNYEIIFVNDGSPDNSLDIALSLYNEDPKVTVIDLSRNFGQHKALMTGLAYTVGEFVFIIDVDLEEQPELVNSFWEKMQSEQNLDVVYGVQDGRRGGWLEQLSGSFFYKAFNRISTIRIPENLITARLMTKTYVDALVRHKEQELFLAGLWASTGFRQIGLPVQKLSHSPTTYSFGKKISLLVNAITSFTSQPLIYIFYLGVIMSFLSFIYIGWLIFKKIYYESVLAGWTSVIASIWLVGGIIIFSIGMLGIYMSKIFTEVKNRPYTVIKRKYMRK